MLVSCVYLVVGGEVWRTGVVKRCEDGMLVFHWGWKSLSPFIIKDPPPPCSIYVWINRFPYLFLFSIILFIFILDFKIILKTFKLSLHSLDSNSKSGKGYEISLLCPGPSILSLYTANQCVCMCACLFLETCRHIEYISLFLFMCWFIYLWTLYFGSFWKKCQTALKNIGHIALFRHELFLLAFYNTGISLRSAPHTPPTCTLWSRIACESLRGSMGMCQVLCWSVASVGMGCFWSPYCCHVHTEMLSCSWGILICTHCAQSRFLYVFFPYSFLILSSTHLVLLLNLHFLWAFIFVFIFGFI